MQGHRFEPWSGKIPHASEQLSLCATTTEPVLQSPRGTTPEAQRLEPVLCNKRNHGNEKPAHHNKDPTQNFPSGTVVKNLPVNAGDTGSRPGLGRSHMTQSN